MIPRHLQYEDIEAERKKEKKRKDKEDAHDPPVMAKLQAMKGIDRKGIAAQYKGKRVQTNNSSKTSTKEHRAQDILNASRNIKSRSKTIPTTWLAAFSRQYARTTSYLPRHRAKDEAICKAPQIHAFIPTLSFPLPFSTLKSFIPAQHPQA